MALPVRRSSSESGENTPSRLQPPAKPQPTEAAPPDYSAALPDLDGGLPSLDEMPLLGAVENEKSNELPSLASQEDELDNYLEQLEADAPEDDFDAIFAATPEPVKMEDELPTVEELPDLNSILESIPEPTPKSNQELPTDDEFESFIDQAFENEDFSLDDDEELEAPLEDVPSREELTLEPDEPEDDWAADFEKLLEEESNTKLDDEEIEAEVLDESPEEELDPEEETEFDPDAKEPEESEKEIVEPDEDEVGKPLSKRGGKRSSGKRNKSPITKLSEGLFRILTLIPFIGRIFKPLQRFARFLVPVLILILVLAIPFGLYSFAGNSIENPPILTFPDGGSAVISDFKFDQATMTASGTITNTGDVIADVKPVFSVWAYELGLNPSKWLAFQELGTCEGEEVSVDIDGTAEVSAKCDFETIDGITPKASGSLVY